MFQEIAKNAGVSITQVKEDIVAYYLRVNPTSNGHVPTAEKILECAIESVKNNN